jgi:hypothetical protein
MDTIDNAEFANNLGHFFQTVAQQTGDFLHSNIDTLSRDRIDLLSDEQTRLITYANTFFSLSDAVAFDGSDQYFKAVSAATDQINQNLKTMKDVDKVINITAGIISMASAIVSRNGGGILSSLQSVLKAASA